MKVDIEFEKTKLEEAIRKNDRGQVITLLKRKTFKYLNDEEKKQIARDAIGLRNINIMKVLSKKLPQFTPQMFEMDIKNMKTRLFMNQVLDKYAKKFDIKDNEIQHWLIKISCQIGNRNMINQLLKIGVQDQELVWLADAPEDIFEMLAGLRWDMIESNIVIEILLKAVNTEEGMGRLVFLKKAGCLLDVRGTDGRTAEERLMVALQKGAKGRQEIRVQQRRRRALKILRETQNRRERKFHNLFT